MHEDDMEASQVPWTAPERSPIVTWALLGANFITWLVATAAGGTDDPDVLLDFGAMFAPLIAAGEYWRLFTAMFLHVGVAHLALNGFALFIFGQLVERAYGHVRFLTIYVLAGLFGSVTSFLFNTISIGAGSSGAVFGVLGALAAFFVAEREMFGAMARRNLTGVLVIGAISLVYGLVTPGIDNWAHMGGFAGGFAIGLALAPQYRLQRTPFGTPIGMVDVNSLAKRLWVLPVAAALLLVGVWLGARTMSDNPYTHKVLAERHYEDGSYQRALDEVEAALRLDEFWGEAYYLRGKILAEVGDTARARRELVSAARFGNSDTRAKAIALLLRLR